MTKQSLIFSIFALCYTMAYSPAVQADIFPEEPECVMPITGEEDPVGAADNRGCPGKPTNPPRGSCWGVCQCTCKTNSSSKRYGCWYTLPPGVPPKNADCKQFQGDPCSLDGVPGTLQWCSVN